MSGRRTGRPSFMGHPYWWLERGVAVTVEGSRARIVRVSRSGFPLDGAVVDLRYIPREHWHEHVNREVVMMLEKNGKKHVQDDGCEPAPDPEAMGRWPTLWLWLTQTTWPNGDQRKTSTIVLFSQDGMVKGMVRDKEDDTCLWMTARTLFGCLDALEEGLCSVGAIWR